MATTAAPPLSLEEFSRLPGDSERHEMSEGELITMAPVKSLHSRLARLIFKLLESYLDKSGAAEAFPEAGYVLSRSPLTIRQPDVSVLSKERVLATAEDNYFEGGPELAIEVVSPSDSAEDLELKAKQYLKAGSSEVWVLYPKTKDIHVFAASGEVKVLGEGDVLQSALLPGFSVKVAELFLQ